MTAFATVTARRSLQGSCCVLQIDLDGIVRAAAKELELQIEVSLPLAETELPWGVSDVCVQLPTVFALIQTVCCDLTTNERECMPCAG
jgi:hypothetical protein